MFHFMNLPLTVEQLLSAGGAMNSSGGWMAALLGQLLAKTDHSFACLCFGAAQREESSPDGRIACYEIPCRWDDCGRGMERALSASLSLLEKWQPDLIHVHGTEGAYGLLRARGLTTVPTVISLQGLVGACAQWHAYFGDNNLKEILRMHRLLEFPTLRGLLIGYWRFRKMAAREEAIIRGNGFFMGRTDWDRATLQALNPQARYFHAGELLRAPFRQGHWELAQARRHRIIFTSAGHPRKGIEVLLQAVKLLKKSYPDIELAIAGSISTRSGYGRYIRRLIAEAGPGIVELGALPAERMSAEMAGSHVFVSPSYIDNSSNSVCEAQMVGMPVVATYTGGVPTLVAEGSTGLFFSPGDAPMLAMKLRRIFEDDRLAAALGKKARQVALERHDPDSVLGQVEDAYQEVLRG